MSRTTSRPHPTTGGSTATPRMSAEERREAILEAALVEFAGSGLFGTSTEAIARRAGVSQPYLFRLYGTKLQLYIACVERGFDQVLQLFQAAADGSPDPFTSMGLAYQTLLSDRVSLLNQLHAYAACGDQAVQSVVRVRYRQIHEWLLTVPGATPQRVHDFMAVGMLLNVVAAMDLFALGDEGDSWARRLCDGFRP